MSESLLKPQQIGHAASGFVMVSDGTRFQAVAPAASGPISEASVTLTAAQVAALQATPITVVAAPGSGFAFVPLGGEVDYKFGTRPFGPDGAVSLRVAQAPVALNAVAVNAASIRTTTQDGVGHLAQLVGSLANRAGYENLPLKVFSSASLNGGSVATSSVASGGAGYVVTDTAESTDGGGLQATIDATTLGVVTAFTITNVGTFLYSAGDILDMAALVGVGTGFQIQVDSVDKGDGTLKVTVYYATVTLQ